jgi:RNA polymerase sigma factor (sigma-70 family)
LNTHHSIQQASDPELIERYRRDGDKLLVGILFKRYTHLVLGVCMKYLKNENDSKDAVMQIFEKLFTDLNKYPVGHFKSWLHTVTKNYCLMQIRSKRGKHFEPIEDADGSIEVVESAASLHPANDEKEERLSLMEKGILELNEEQRTCVKLFYLEELSYQQVADRTGYNLLQVKSYIQNGKRNLRIFMENNG